jgi:chromosomal replication initiator protein
MNVQPRELSRHYKDIRKRLRDTPPKPVEPEPIMAEPVVDQCATCGSIMVDDGAAVTISRIISAVCSHYNVLRMDLIGSRRNLKVARPRQVAMYLARELTALSYGQIGLRLGGRDHTTLIHGVKKVEALILKDPDIGTEIDAIRRGLLGS